MKTGNVIRHFNPVATYSKGRRISSAQHAHAAWHADRTISESVFKIVAVFSQFIKIRGVDQFVSAKVDCVVSLLICIDYQDIRPFHNDLASFRFYKALTKTSFHVIIIVMQIKINNNRITKYLKLIFYIISRG
jgi:hypothetical protein